MSPAVQRIFTVYGASSGAEGRRTERLRVARFPAPCPVLASLPSQSPHLLLSVWLPWLSAGYAHVARREGRASECRRRRQKAAPRRLPHLHIHRWGAEGMRPEHKGAAGAPSLSLWPPSRMRRLRSVGTARALREETGRRLRRLETLLFPMPRPRRQGSLPVHRQSVFLKIQPDTQDGRMDGWMDN